MLPNRPHIYTTPARVRSHDFSSAWDPKTSDPTPGAAMPSSASADAVISQVFHNLHLMFIVGPVLLFVLLDS